MHIDNFLLFINDLYGFWLVVVCLHGAVSAQVCKNIGELAFRAFLGRAYCTVMTIAVNPENY